MDKVSKEDFHKASAIKPKEENEEKPDEKPNEKNMDELLKDIENPVLAQKRMAVQIKGFLDKRISEELESKGILSENTRKWVDSYNNLLDKIQKALSGDKSASLHLHKVSHSDIASKIRDSEKKHG